MEKLAQDEQRTDKSSILDTDVSGWINAPISWGYETLLDKAKLRFEEFIDLMGPKDARSKYARVAQQSESTD